MTAQTPGPVDPWQVITDLAHVLLDGDGTGARLRAIDVLSRNGISLGTLDAGLKSWHGTVQEPQPAHEGTPVYLAAITTLSAALRDIHDIYDTGTAAHDIAHRALDDTDRVHPQPQPAPELATARAALRDIALGTAGDPSVAADEALTRMREAAAAGTSPDVRPVPGRPRWHDVTCGVCGAESGTSRPFDDIECGECEARRCPHCGGWFGGSRD